MSLSIIVARAENGVIGKDNRLIWHLSDDLKRFKSLTMGHAIIMGRKTFESLPKVLPGRVHYVLTGSRDYEAPEGVRLFHSVEELLSALPEDENFVIGGEHMYREMLPYADTLYITEIRKSYEGDAFFPEFDGKEWELVEKKQHRGTFPMISAPIKESKSKKGYYENCSSLLQPRRFHGKSSQSHCPGSGRKGGNHR